MNKSLYMSPLGLEILVCSQENISVYLPFESVLNTATDDDVLYAIQELVKSEVLASDSAESGFDILSEAQRYLRPIFNPLAVLKIIIREPQSSKICYLADDEVTVIEEAFNRLDKLRLTMMNRSEFSAFVSESFDVVLPDEAFDNSELMESDEAESEIVKIGLNGSIENVAQKEDVIMVTDIDRPDLRRLSRMIVYRTGNENRLAVFSGNHVSENSRCDNDTFKNRFDFILEEL